MSSMIAKSPTPSSNDPLQVLINCSKDVAKKEMIDHDQEHGGGVRAAFDDIWSSIIAGVDKDGSSSSKVTAAGSSDDTNPHAPTYIPPTVKRSSSTLSEMSLQVCTESLGSETGSDGFSSYPSSPEPVDKLEHQPPTTADVVVIEEEKMTTTEEVESQVPNHTHNNNNCDEILLSNTCCCSNKRSSMTSAPKKSFPPPLPSLSHRRESGSNLIHMRSHRQNGRLVLEAVSVPVTQNYFHAQRQDGRLLLTLATATTTATNVLNKEDEEETGGNVDELGGLKGNEQTHDSMSGDGSGDAEDEEEKSKRDDERNNNINYTAGWCLTSFDGLQLGKWPKGFITIDMQINNNPSSGKIDHDDPHNRFNKVVKTTADLEQEEEQLLPEALIRTPALVAVKTPSLPQYSLPPKVAGHHLITNTALATAAATAATSLNLNTYEYYWRKNNNKPPILPATYSAGPTTAAGIFVRELESDHIHPPTNNKFMKPSSAIVVVDQKHDLQQRSSSLDQQWPNNSSMVLMKTAAGGSREYLVPLILKQQLCKEPRKSVLFWENYCIATT